MADVRPTWLPDPRPFVALVMALTALVTAGTSLVKAFDKTLEQASYEALATSIQELQQDQAALRLEMQAHDPQDTDGVVDAQEPEEILSTPAVPSAAVSVGPKPKMASIQKHKAPTTVAPINIVEPSPSKSRPMRRGTMPAPPSWSTIKTQAEKL